jgi:hypothetical protein
MVWQSLVSKIDLSSARSRTARTALWRSLVFKSETTSPCFASCSRPARSSQRRGGGLGVAETSRNILAKVLWLYQLCREDSKPSVPKMRRGSFSVFIVPDRAPLIRLPIEKEARAFAEEVTDNSVHEHVLLLAMGDHLTSDSCTRQPPLNDEKVLARHRQFGCTLMNAMNR